jgi:antitoxin VapB
MSGFEDSRVSFDPPRLLAKLFRHGGSQAVRLPKAFRFEGDCVTVRREGSAVILEPAMAETPHSPAEWKAFWARIDGLSDDEFPGREQPAAQERDFGV